MLSLVGEVIYFIESAVWDGIYPFPKRKGQTNPPFVHHMDNIDCNIAMRFYWKHDTLSFNPLPIAGTAACIRRVP